MGSQIESWLEVVSELSSVEIRLIETAVLLLIFLALRTVLLVMVRRHVADDRSRYHWRKGITYALAIAGLFIAARIWFVGFRYLATFLGIAAAGLVIALKEPLLNIAAWLFLIWRRPFSVGDRIEVSGHIGDVIDVRIFQFSLLEVGNWVGADQSTGRVIHVPNGLLFTEPVANYTRGFPYIWNELEIAITYESNWRAAKALLLEVAKEHGHTLTDEAEDEVLALGRRFMIFYTTLAPTVYTRISDRGIALAVRYVCDPRRRRDSEQEIWEAALDAFAAHEEIDLAYPTQRFFDRASEVRTLRGSASGEHGLSHAPTPENDPSR
ncbi:MAG TPA: mechanosensitive ion channel domain-containing protein [Longimicrobiales bacterium]|nr:mechanosensitive ion channel domain-containing protein [Longimicrobiales bacterium]